MSPSPDAVVIGGSGFIGGQLVRALAERGASVRVVSRSVQSGAWASPQVQCVRGDVTNREQMAAAVKGARIVYHLAAGFGNTWQDFERGIVEGTRNVAESCLQHGVERLIFTSSIAALYLGAAGRIDERTGADPRPEGRSHYSRAKGLAERLLGELHANSRLPVVILRPAVVVGEGGMLTHGGLGIWASDLCCIGWGRGRKPLPFVLASDVVDALMKAGDVPGIEGLTFNLAGDVRPTAVEFLQILRSRARRNFRFYPQSLWKMQALEAGKWLLKIAARKPDNPFPSYRDLKSRALACQLDCSLAKEKLGWQPVQDAESFFAEAIDSHLPAIPAGDLRRPPVFA
jgi:nucleoside-diphosphate-sugar epimerase